MMSNVLCENDTQCHTNEAVVNGNGKFIAKKLFSKYLEFVIR